MTGDNITKVLDIRVNYDKALTQLGRYKQDIDQIKEAEKQLKQELKDGTITQERYSKQMAALEQNKKHLQASTKDLTRVVQNNIKAEKEQAGSLTQLRAKLSNLTRAYDQLSQAERNSMKGSRLKVQINEVTKAIKDAEMATQRFYRNVGNYQSALLGLRELGGAFKTFGGVVAGVLGGLGLDRIANTMLDVAKNFEDGMARVRAVSNPNSGEFTQLRDEALRLGRTTKYTATEVANAMEDLARKGFTASQTVQMTSDILRLAQANVVSMSDAAQVATSSMRAFQIGSEETGRVVDVMSSACSHSATNLTMLGEAMKTAGPAANAANVSLEETTALIGSLANVGMTGSDAGTGVKQVLMALTTAAHGTERARQTLAHYNLEVTEARIRNGELLDILKEMKESGIGNSLEDLKNISGRYASPRLANIINNIDETIKLNKDLEMSIGENDRMFDQSIGKTSQALLTLKSAWEGMLIEMYDSTSEYLVTPLNWLTEAIRFASKQITFLGQTFTSVLVAMMAGPAWKGLTTLGGVIAATWEQARVKGTADLTELTNAYAVAEENFQAIREKYAAVEAKGRELYKNAQIATQTEITLKHEIEEAKRTKITELAEAKRNGMKKRELNKLEATHSKHIATLEKQLAKHTEYRIECEALVTRNFQEQSMLRADMDAATNAKFSAGSKLRVAEAMAPTGLKAAWGTFFGFMKTGLKSIFSLAKSFLPFLIIFGVMEFIQGLNHIQKLLSEVNDAESKVNEKMNTTVAEDKKIAKLRAMKDMLRAIQEEQQKSGKLSEQSHKSLIAIGNRLNLSKKAIKDMTDNLKVQKGTYDEISKAIDDMVKKQEKAAKKQALTGIMTEAQTTVMKLIPKYGIKTTDLREASQEMYKIFNKQPGAEKAWQVFTKMWGAENMWGDSLRVDAAMKQYDYALSLLKGLGLEDEDLDITKAGPYNPSNYMKDKKGTDLSKSLENEINKWTDTLKKLQYETNNDNYQKALEKANEELDKILRDIETRVAPGGNPTKGTLYKAFQAEPARAKVLKQIFAQVKEAIKLKRPNDISNIDYDKFVKDIDTEILHLESRKETLPNYVREYFEKEGEILMNQEIKEMKLLKKDFYQGVFGATKEAGTYEDIEKGLEEYENKRMEIIRKANNGEYGRGWYSEERKEEAMKDLEKEYKAEAEYYNRLQIMENKYEQQRRANRIAQIEAENAIREQGIQNELEMIKLKYQTELNLAYDHYEDLKYASEEYWNALKERIGADEADVLRIEYKAAQAELEDVRRRGRAKNETMEAYQAREIAAKKKVEEIHTKANLSIEKSDETRLKAAADITQGLIALTDLRNEEDKGAAKLAKMLALAQIAISTAEAIAKMTSQESGKGIIGIGTMAAGIGTILANMAQAASILKSAKFARGAVNIGGAGSETSDSIPAYISRGESVMNAKATKMFEPILIAMNNIGNGIALPRNNYVQTQQTADITEAFTTAVANVRPVVDVREITRTQNRVETLQNLDSL